MGEITDAHSEPSVISRPAPTARSALTTYVAAVTVTTGGMLPVMLLGTLAVQIRASLGFPTGHIAILVAIFFLASAGVSVFAGGLCQRRPLRLTLVSSAALSTLSLLGTAAAAMELVTFAITMLAGAAAAALSTPATNELVAANLAPHRQGVAHGVKQAAIPLAGVLAGLAVPIVGLTLGWRWGFALAALVPATGIIASWRATQHANMPRPRSPQPARAATSRAPPRALRYLAIGVGCGAAAITSIHSFSLLAAADAGLDEGDAGIYIAVGSVIVIVVRIGAGVRADRVSTNRLVPVAGMLAASVAGYLIMMSGDPSFMGFGIVVTLTFGWGWPGLLTLAVVELYPDRAAVTTGTIMAAIFAGGFGGPLIFAAIESTGSFSAAWAAMAGLAIVASATILAGSRT